MASEKQETLAEVLADFRKRKEMLESAIWSAPLDSNVESMKAQVEILNEFIDRVEAAVRREREAWEEAACRCVSDTTIKGNSAAMRGRDEMLDVIVRIGNWCAQDLAENAYVSDSSGNYLKTLNGLCEVCRPYMQMASKLKRYGGAE